MFTYDHKNIINPCSATKRKGEAEVTKRLDFSYFLLYENKFQFLIE